MPNTNKKPIEYAEETEPIPQPPSHFDDTGRNVSLCGVVIDRRTITNVLDSSKMCLSLFRGVFNQ